MIHWQLITREARNKPFSWAYQYLLNKKRPATKEERENGLWIESSSAYHLLGLLANLYFQSRE